MLSSTGVWHREMWELCSKEQSGVCGVAEVGGEDVTRLGETTGSLCGDNNHASVRLCIVEKCEREREI